MANDIIKLHSNFLVDIPLVDKMLHFPKIRKVLELMMLSVTGTKGRPDTIILDSGATKLLKLNQEGIQSVRSGIFCDNAMLKKTRAETHQNWSLAAAYA